MPDEPLRVGLVGFGLAGQAFHAPLIAVTPGLRLAAVVTGDAERARTATAHYPGVTVHPTADALLADAASLDIAVIATPNRTHVPLARRALEAGLHVVVDKPFAPTPEEGAALAAEATRRGRVLTVYQNRRWDGDFLTVARLVREGALGEVFRFESRFERWRPAPRGGWRESADPAEAGGTLYDLGSHLIDQAQLLFGRATSVYAEIERRRPGVEADDDVFLSLTHASGTRSHLWMSAIAAQGGPRFRVLGSRVGFTKAGTDPQEAALRAGARPGPGWGEDAPEQWGQLGAGDALVPVRTEPGAYQRFYSELARAVLEGAPAPVDPMDAVAGLAVIVAARRSAAEKRVVTLGD